MSNTDRAPGLHAETHARSSATSSSEAFSSDTRASIPFRTLKCPPERPNRTVSREAMRRAVRAVHVMPSRDGWVARRLADDREHETFASREDARTFARSLAAELDVDVFLHDEGRYAILSDSET
jgi:hypothetical protein